MDRFLRRGGGGLAGGRNRRFQYPRCWIVSSDAVIAFCAVMAQRHFQYPRCWIVSSDCMTKRPCCASRALSVSSLLDRFLRPVELRRVADVLQHFQYPRCWIVSSDQNSPYAQVVTWTFQYPRCWIVSSDDKPDACHRLDKLLSVSSLLDRFLRRKSSWGPG